MRLDRLVISDLSDGACELLEAMLEARSQSTSGTPKGGVISPLLANIFLHQVLDEWFAKAVRPQKSRSSGARARRRRLAVTFELEADARRLLADLPRHLGKFGLEVAPEKTRLLRFGLFSRRDAKRLGGTVVTFDVLGFRHRCGPAAAAGSR